MSLTAIPVQTATKNNTTTSNIDIIHIIIILTIILIIFGFPKKYIDKMFK